MGRVGGGGGGGEGLSVLGWDEGLPLATSPRIRIIEPEISALTTSTALTLLKSVSPTKTSTIRALPTTAAQPGTRKRALRREIGALLVDLGVQMRKVVEKRRAPLRVSLRVAAAPLAAIEVVGVAALDDAGAGVAGEFLAQLTAAWAKVCPTVGCVEVGLGAGGVERLRVLHLGLVLVCAAGEGEAGEVVSRRLTLGQQLVEGLLDRLVVDVLVLARL